MANSIKIGAQGEAVTRIQQLLVERGYHVSVDSFFGPETENAVKQFQDEHGLKVDGIVGINTVEALMPKREKRPYAPPTRHKVRDLDTEEILGRANACVGGPINYHLKYPNGGQDPDSNMPCDEQTGGLDCSGFTAWCQGYDRDFMTGLSATLDRWDGYSNTDSKIAEAEREGKVYTVVPLEDAQPGDLLVGESYRRLYGGRKIGHEGVITAVGNVKRDGLAGLSVVHCSPSNVKLNPAKSAVWKTSGKLWGGYRKIRVLRFNRDYVRERLAEMTKK
jgi:hypothetical protein